MGIQSDIGGEVAVQWPALPVNAAAGTTTSSAVDRLGILSVVLAHACGAATGTPDSFTIATKLQHSHSTTSGDFVDAGFTVTTLAADSTSAYTDVNLGPLRQYLRTVTVTTFVNGTTPKVALAVGLILGPSAAGTNA